MIFPAEGAKKQIEWGNATESNPPLVILKYKDGSYFMSNQVEPIYPEEYKPEVKQNSQPQQTQQKVHENLDLKTISDPASAANNISGEVSQKLKRLDRPLVDLAILLQENKDQIVVTPNGDCYHYASCSTLSNTRAASRITIPEAKGEGYRACEVCKTPQ